MLRALPLLSLLLLLFRLHAQDTTGQIVGVITDSSKAIIVGAEISIVSATTGVRAWQGKSGKAGDYAAPALPVDVYNISVNLNGFRPVQISNFPLSVSDRARVDAVLEPGSVQDAVTVSGGHVTRLETDTSFLGTEVGKENLQSLPLPNRDILNLLSVVPGVSSGGDPTGISPSQLSVNGSRTLNSEFTVSGISVVSGATGYPQHYPSPDALQEFKVLTSSYSAEYGRTSGASVNMVVASGNNKFHGGLYEYFRNEDLNANNFFNNVQRLQRPPDRRNQFGAKLGGPVRFPHLYDGHDRTFFFFDYEGQRQLNPINVTSTIPDAAFASGDFSRSPVVITDPVTRAPYPSNKIPPSLFDPAAVKILSLLPAPNTTGTFDAQNNRYVSNYVLSKSSPSQNNATTARVDHTISDKTRFFTFFDQSRNTNTTSTQIPGLLDPGSGSNTGRNYLASANLTELFTPSLIAELRFGFTRFVTVIAPPSTGVNVQQAFGIASAPAPYAPTFNIANYTTFGNNSNTYQSQIDNIFQTAGSATWVKGTHVVKWGGQLRKSQFNVFNPGGNLAGAYTFTGELTSANRSQNNAVNSLADFLLGQIKSAVYQIPQPESGRRNYNLGLFIQDDWRVNSRLTVNFGLREEYESPVTTANKMYSRVDPYTGKLLVAGVNASQSLNLPTPVKNLAPRAGFAYQITPKTVLRSGFGIFFSQNFSNLGGVISYPGYSITQSFASIGTGVAQPFSLSQGVPLVASQTFNPLQVAANATQANPLVPAGVAYGDLSSLPNALEWNFGLQREVVSRLIVEANYVGTRGIHLPLSIRFNNAPSFEVADRVNATGSNIAIQSVRPFPTVTAINEFTNVGSSQYHSLQLRAIRQFARSFSFQATYTFSKSTDDGSGIFASSQPNGLDAGQFPQLSRRLDHSVSAFDRTHSGTIVARYTTGGPAWLRGFSIDPLFTARSGLPLTISQSNLYPDVIQQRPNVTGPITQIYASQMTSVGNGIRYLLPSTDPNFPLTPTGPLFASIAGKNTLLLPASVGTLGRYPIRALGDVNVNLAISRRFQFREWLAFTVRADSYNTFNHTNFGSPNVSLAVTASALAQPVFSSPTFGLITSARNARINQLIARFDF